MQDTVRTYMLYFNNFQTSCQILLSNLTEKFKHFKIRYIFYVYYLMPIYTFISVLISKLSSYIYMFFATKKPEAYASGFYTGDEGIEPPPKVLETPIIPLDQSPIT